VAGKEGGERPQFGDDSSTRGKKKKLKDVLGGEGKKRKKGGISQCGDPLGDRKTLGKKKKKKKKVEDGRPRSAKRFEERDPDPFEQLPAEKRKSKALVMNVRTREKKKKENDHALYTFPRRKKKGGSKGPVGRLQRKRKRKKGGARVVRGRHSEEKKKPPFHRKGRRPPRWRGERKERETEPRKCPRGVDDLPGGGKKKRRLPLAPLQGGKKKKGVFGSLVLSSERGKKKKTEVGPSVRAYHGQEKKTNRVTEEKRIKGWPLLGPQRRKKEKRRKERKKTTFPQCFLDGWKEEKEKTPSPFPSPTKPQRVRPVAPSLWFR